MIRIISITLLCFITGLAVYSQSEESVRKTHFNVDNNGLAIQGYDPVSFFGSNGPQEGKEEFSYKFRDITYRFANSESLDNFMASPEKYEPEYGGWCAYAMGESGEEVKIDPETFKIIDGKLYLFYNFLFNNTLKDWNANEKPLKLKADKNWKNIIN